MHSPLLLRIIVDGAYRFAFEKLTWLVLFFWPVRLLILYITKKLIPGPLRLLLKWQTPDKVESCTPSFDYTMMRNCKPK